MITRTVLVMIVGALLALPLSASSARAEINIFACTPEWGALASEIGGKHVDVYVATKATQDPHHIRAKPSLLAKMRSADLVFCNGASLEEGWLPVLLRKAGSAAVQPNKVGYFMAADQVDLLDTRAHTDRSQGHIHPEGNPHLHLDYGRVLTVAESLSSRLSEIDPEHEEHYSIRLQKFSQMWQEKGKRWSQVGHNLKDRNYVVTHSQWLYLQEWLPIHFVADLEPKPGLPPTAQHLQSILDTIVKGDITGIIVGPFDDRQGAEWLSEKSGLPIIDLPFTVGGSDDAQSLSALFDVTISRLLEAE